MMQMVVVRVFHNKNKQQRIELIDMTEVKKRYRHWESLSALLNKI